MEPQAFLQDLLVIGDGIFFAARLNVSTSTESITRKGDQHMKRIQRSIAALLVSGALSVGLVGPAAAQAHARGADTLRAGEQVRPG